jgi:hypothetical protein
MDLSFYTWPESAIRGEGTTKMSDERVLRTLARKVMKTGSLPESRPERMWGGPGGGSSCALCGMTIRGEEMEFELQFSSREDPGAGNYHVHVRCFAAWELERRNAESTDNSLPRVNDSHIMAGRELSKTKTNEGELG